MEKCVLKEKKKVIDLAVWYDIMSDNLFYTCFSLQSFNLHHVDRLMRHYILANEDQYEVMKLSQELLIIPMEEKTYIKWNVKFKHI